MAAAVEFNEHEARVDSVLEFSAKSKGTAFHI